MALPTTDLEIANMALANIGHTVQIGNLTSDSTTEARNARLFLDSEREILLGSFDWNFARERAVLVQATGTGDWWNSVDDDWDYVYSLPANCVEPRYLYPGTRNPTPQEREPFERARNAADNGFVLLCDVKPVTSGDKAPVLFYTARITVVSEYPQPFVSLFAWALGWRLAVPVMGEERGEAKRKEIGRYVTAAYVDAVRCDVQSKGRDQEPPTPSLAARGVSWTPRVTR